MDATARRRDEKESRTFNTGCVTDPGVATIIRIKMQHYDHNLNVREYFTRKWRNCVLFYKSNIIYGLLKVPTWLRIVLERMSMHTVNSYIDGNPIDSSIKTDVVVFTSGTGQICSIARYMHDTEDVTNLFNMLEEHIKQNVNSTVSVYCNELMYRSTFTDANSLQPSPCKKKKTYCADTDFCQGDSHYNSHYNKRYSGKCEHLSLSKCHNTSHLKLRLPNETKTHQNKRETEHRTQHQKQSFLTKEQFGKHIAAQRETRYTIQVYPLSYIANNELVSPSYPTQASGDQGQDEVVINSGFSSIIPQRQFRENSRAQTTARNTITDPNRQSNRRREGTHGQSTAQPACCATGTTSQTTQYAFGSVLHGNSDSRYQQPLTNGFAANTENDELLERQLNRPEIHVKSARYPDYIEANRRQITFTNWPPRAQQDPTHLCNLGFFYTGQGDLVRCHQCGIGLKDFCDDDEPLLEHVRYSDNCPFLLQLLGPDQLTVYKETLVAGNPNHKQQSRPQQPLRPNAAGNVSGCINESSSTAAFAPPGSSSRASPAPSGSSSTSSAQLGTTPTRRGQQISFSHVEYKHPEYSSLPVRISSFSKWPPSLMQTPKQLAEAGFYYTGMKDVVRCCACDGGLQKWDPADDPWIEHCRWFPTCHYARHHKGDEYIALVQHAATETNTNQEQQAGASSPVRATTPSGDAELHMGVNEMVIKDDDNSIFTDEARKLIEMGYTQADVRASIKKLKQRDVKKPTVGDIIDTIEDATKEPVSQATARTASGLLDENERLKSFMLCMMCNKNTVNALFLPCTHHRMCMSCVHSLTHCPICDMVIQEKIKTYMS